MEILFGGVVTILTQVLKTYVTETWKKIAICVVLSLVAAMLQVFLVSAGYWEAAMNTLIAASGIYALLVRPFEN